MSGGKKLTNCPKCGLDWIGTSKCDCGWSPNPFMPFIKGFLCLAVLAGAGGAVYLGQHYNEYFPNDEAAQKHVAKAEDEFQRTNFADSVQEYRTAISLNPKRVDIRRKLALALLNDNRPHEAAEEMQIAYKMAPHDLEVRKEYISLLEKRGDVEQAAQLLEQLVTDEPKESDLKYHLAEIYANIGNTAKAKQLFIEFTKSKPKVNGPWMSLARLQDNEGKPKDAIATLRQGLTQLPNDPPMLQQLGTVLGADGQTAEAVKALTRASELEPSSAEYNSHLISAIRDRNKDIPAETEIPLRKNGNHYMIKAFINDNREVTMLLDTGATDVAITTRLATDLGLTPKDGKPVLMGSATGIALSRQINLPSLRVGNAKQLLVPCVVMPPGPVDGILGMSFLHRYQFTIDSTRNMLVLKRK